MIDEVKVNRLETTRIINEMTGKYYESLRQLRAENKGAVWIIGQLPFELFVALDIPFLQWENFAVRAASRKAEGQFKKVSESMGFSPDVCSYARISSGAAMLGEQENPSFEFPEFLMPRASAITCATICPSMGYWYEFNRRFFKAPTFALDIPCRYDPEDQAEFNRGVAYVESQLLDFIHFLEELSGRRLDWDRLKEIMKIIKRSAELRKEVMDLTRAVPSPMNFFDGLITLAPINILRGRPDALDYFEKLKAEVQDRVAKGIGTIPNERHRLYWDHIGIWYKVGAMSKKFAAYGAAVLVGFYTTGQLYHEPEQIDPEHPLHTMAEALFMRLVPRNASLRYRVDEIVKLVEDFKLDGLIMHSSRTCRPPNLGQPDVIRMVRERTGVPGLLLESDHCDPAFYDEAYINGAFESFFELLDSRQAGRPV